MQENTDQIEKIRSLLKLEPEVKIVVQRGDDLNLEIVNRKNLDIPDSRDFFYIKHFNVRTNRWSQSFLCQYDGCEKLFHKWHNFFDHLRIHTNDKPYVCPYEGCVISFSQKANLTKHIQIHKGIRKFQCERCDMKFYTKFNLQVNHILIVVQVHYRTH